jgi:membrane-bound lytic murein transglycosylase D
MGKGIFRLFVGFFLAIVLDLQPWISPNLFAGPISSRALDSYPVTVLPDLPTDFISITPNQAVASPRRWSFVLSRPQSVPPFPVVLNLAVRKYIRAVLAHPLNLELSFDRCRPFLSQMVRLLEQRNLPPDLVYLTFAESNFARGGAGPWQLTKATARRFGLRIDQEIDERRDPIMSTQAAAELLASLHGKSGDWQITLVAWNEGERALDRFWMLRGIRYGSLARHLPARTRSLLDRFMADAFIARNASTFGMQQVSYNDPPPYHLAMVPGGTPLRAIARSHHTTVSELRWYNPAILGSEVPRDFLSFPVRIPGTRLTVATSF